MIKDFLISFKDSISKKATNPFLGTYFGVWLIRNWDLVYAVFNFDEVDNLQTRLAYINHYYTHCPFFENLCWNLLIAFAVLIATYTVLGLSRLIVNTYDKRIAPHISKITDSNSIVDKDVHKLVINNVNDLEQKLNQSREDKSKLQSESIKHEKELEDIKVKLINYNRLEADQKTSHERILKLEEDNKDLVSKFNNALKNSTKANELKSLYREDLISMLQYENYYKTDKHLFETFKSLKSKSKLEYTPLEYPINENYSQGEIKSTYTNLVENRSASIFKVLCERINKNIWTNNSVNSKEITDFKSKGLIIRLLSTNDETQYELTEKGKLVYQYIKNMST